MKTSGFFFWKRRPVPVIAASVESEADRQERLLKSVMNQFVALLPQVRAAMNNNTLSAISEGQVLGTLFDFYARWDGGLPITATDDEFMEKEDMRKEATPKSVLDELEKIPTPVTMFDLDAKIELFSRKASLVRNRHTQEQINGFINRLKNRKHYDEHHEFFERFPNTTDGRIEALLEKYKLVLKPSELFIPTFPKDAVTAMEKYKDAVSKFTKESPVFYVIAEAKDFKKKDERDDPILLVQSPFGFFWQILGAWDKEMLLLSEL